MKLLLAQIKHEIFARTFDYDAEARRYDEILKNHLCKSVLELACGTGLLGKHLVNAGYDYVGVDLEKDMLAVARKTVPGVKFVQGDMRHLEFPGGAVWEAVVIGGRVFYHLTTNKEVMSCFSSIWRLLRPAGLLLFEIFDASHTFLHFKRWAHRVVRVGDVTYQRKVRFRPLLDTGWTSRARERYIASKPDSRQVFVSEFTVRSFLPAEIRLLLEIGGFAMKTCFPLVESPGTLLVHAQKK